MNYVAVMQDRDNLKIITILGGDAEKNMNFARRIFGEEIIEFKELIGLEPLAPKEFYEWMELIKECVEKEIPFQDVRKFVRDYGKPKQLMARIYSEKFKEVNKIEINA